MIKTAIVGYGNIGKAVADAIAQSGDMTLAALASRKEIPHAPAPVLRDFAELKDVDVAILCTPSRSVPDMAPVLLKKGIFTVDSFDIHSEVPQLRTTLDAIAKEHSCAAITAAGWDPGSDSVIRALLMAMIPKGITDTDFGPGMSMGHTVAVKAAAGVRDALSMTIPLGSGLHRRMVYVELEPDADFEKVSDTIRRDDYFVRDETHVIQVPSVDRLKDVGHGVRISRKGTSGTAGNQRAEFQMSINNPALTGQILVSAARAVLRQAPGCYTMIQIPPVDFLPGDAEDWIKELV